MTTAEILSRVNACIASAPEGAWVRNDLKRLADDLAAMIRLETAAQRGSLNAAKTIARLLAEQKKLHTRPALEYAWDDAQGRQCVCDGYRAFRLTERLPLEDRPDNAGEPIDLDKVFAMYAIREDAKAELPSVAELKAHIAIERARISPQAKRHGTEATWDFGEGKPAVNAAYLLDALAVLGDDAEAFFATTDRHFGALAIVYLRSARGDALILPMFIDAKRAQHEKQKAAAEAAAQERREHPERVERRERHAKRLRERLDEYAARLREDPTYALSPDEFADLARYADDYAA